MNKKIIAALLLSSLAPKLLADSFGEGFGVGAFTGLVGGIITSKIASANTPPPVVVVEDPYLAQKQYDLACQEEQLRQNRLAQRRKERQLALQEQENYAQQMEIEQAQRNAAAQRARARAQANTVREVTIVETKTLKPKKDRSGELHERELALKEQEVKLALIKEENRKRELSIKEKELELQIARAKKQSGSTKVVTTKKIVKNSQDDYLDVE